MTFMKCRHVMKSWESGHRQRCVILIYNKVIRTINLVLWKNNKGTEGEGQVLRCKGVGSDMHIVERNFDEQEE